MVNKAKLGLIVLSAFCFGISYAGNVVSTTGKKVPIAQEVGDTDNGADQYSFDHIENLDRNIEAAGKEISALKMNSQLQNLRQQAEKMSIDFAVIRIYGVDNDLKATLQFANHSVIEVSKGDLFENRYRVESISSDLVKLYDTNQNKKLDAPFI